MYNDLLFITSILLKYLLIILKQLLPVASLTQYN